MENQMKEEVIAMKHTIYALQNSQAEILDKISLNSTSRTSMLAVASNKFTQLEQRVSRVESDSIDYANNLDNVTKQMYNLLKKANRLNTLVANLQKTTAFDNNSDEDGSSDLLSEDGSVCFSNVLHRNVPGQINNTPPMENCEEIEEDYSEYTQDNDSYSDDDNINNCTNNMNGRSVQLLTHNVINDKSNTTNNEQLGAQSDSINIKESNTIHNEPLGAQSDSVNINDYNIINNEPLGAQSDSKTIYESNTIHNEPLGTQSDSINMKESNNINNEPREAQSDSKTINESNNIHNEPLGKQSDSRNIKESNNINNEPLEAQSDSKTINESNNIHNEPLGAQSDSINIKESNNINNQPLGAQSDTEINNALKGGRYNVESQYSTLLNSNDEDNSVNGNVVDENETRQDNLLRTLSKEVSKKDLPEIENCNISKSKGRINKNELGYKSRSKRIQNDNRVGFYNNHESYKGYTDKSNIDFQIEKNSVPNIKPSAHNRVDERTMMTSATSYNLTRRARRRERDEDIFSERLFSESYSDQPQTLREWYHYFRQVKAYASARVRSGVVKQAKGTDVILVIDTSERMSECFQRLKSVALQYVYGIEQHAKQHKQCCGMGTGIGLAVFGRETRLIQEATSDYGLLVELIGKLRSGGDAPLVAGLLMGYAGVSSCLGHIIIDVVMTASMIVFTNGSSEQSKRLLQDVQIPNLDLSNLPVPSDITGVIDEIAARSTKIYYVPIGRHQGNNILEHAVRQTNGNIIQVNEMHRLINMPQVIKIALRILADKRFSENQSTDVIRMKISEYMDDIYDDCLEMVKEFSNPLKMYKKRGYFVELTFNTLTLGDRVRRGPYCGCGNEEDFGFAGTVFGQDLDGIMVEWDHGLKASYDYVDGRELQHIVKVNEVRTLIDEPIAVGCRVVRGKDWKYEDTDGGRGTFGTVLSILEEGKSVVRWDNKNVDIYKMGYEGLFEIKLSNSNSLQNEETQKYNKTQQRLKTRETWKHHNDSNTIKSNECDTDDYLIPIYSDVAVSAIWEYKRVSQWTKYPSTTNVKIEKAYQRKKSGNIIIEMDRTTYIIHFSKMVQENVKNKTELAVRRKD
ncbi:uncharacterized protein LOC134715191 [Mytilus trossulus]|uniref:uncharacterized protein LOC134715191 n=1 Tax=Mytilus trossulus TaxID=6551 RepID=UPI003004C178